LTNKQKHQNQSRNSKAAKPMAVDDFVIYKCKTTDMKTDNCRQITTMLRGDMRQQSARWIPVLTML
jgi:hypothetical protein